MESWVPDCIFYDFEQLLQQEKTVYDAENISKNKAHLIKSDMSQLISI